VRLPGGAGLVAVVPAGADTDPVKAYPSGSTTGIGPTQTFAVVEAADKIELQPQVRYQTQGCAWVDWGDNPPGFEGPFCGGSDGNADGVADLNSWGPSWFTQTDPSGFNVFRSNGLMVHWADTSTERHVDVANCINPTLLANNPGLANGINELTQYNVAGRMLVRVQACPGGVAPSTTEIRAFNQNLGDDGVYGQAIFSWFSANGHIVFNTALAPKPTFRGQRLLRQPARRHLRRGGGQARGRPRPRSRPRRPHRPRHPRAEDHAPGGLRHADGG
jgi:hypothetical protein